MAYVNCSFCPAQSYLYGHHGYDIVLEEYRCVSGHKTYVEREKVNGNRISVQPEEDSRFDS